MEIIEEKSAPLKIVLLGNSGVGKTSLVTKYISGELNPSVRPTIGANHMKKTIIIENQKIDMFLWDTAGQEQFRALTPIYVRSAAAAIITTSIIDIESFLNIEHWVELLTNSCDILPPKILAINKIDLITESVISSEEINYKFNNFFDAIFYVSAKSGEGIEELFFEAGRLGFLILQKTEKNNLNKNEIKKKEINNKNCC